MVDDKKAADLPKALAKAVSNYTESELDQQIDFEDFLNLSREPPSLSSRYVKYLHKLVPRRSESVEDDATNRWSMDTNLDDSSMNNVSNNVFFCCSYMTHLHRWCLRESNEILPSTSDDDTFQHF